MQKFKHNFCRFDILFPKFVASNTWRNNEFSYLNI